MAATCGCSIAEKNGSPCPRHGFAEKLEDATRQLVLAIDHKSGVKAAVDRVQEVFSEMRAARVAWRG